MQFNPGSCLFLLVCIVSNGCSSAPENIKTVSSPPVSSQPVAPSSERVAPAPAQPAASSPEPATAPPSVPAPPTSAPDLSAATPAAAASAGNTSLGYCNVRQSAPTDPCVNVRGKSASGIAAGCSHDNCTTAKRNATTNLLTGIPAGCANYIECGAPCSCITK